MSPDPSLEDCRPWTRLVPARVVISQQLRGAGSVEGGTAKGLARPKLTISTNAGLPWAAENCQAVSCDTKLSVTSPGHMQPERSNRDSKEPFIFEPSIKNTNFLVLTTLGELSCSGLEREKVK